MYTYECFFCGVTYRRVEELCACDVCGQPLHGHWFSAVSADFAERQEEPEARRDHPRKPASRRPRPAA